MYEFIVKFNSRNFSKSVNFNKFNVLNSGSVCALYLLQVIIRTAFFCSAKTLLLLKPQHRIQ